MDRQQAYHERLAVPVLWWVLAVLFCGSLGLAVGWYAGVFLGVLATVVPFGVVTALFLGWGGLAVSVGPAADGPAVLAVGRARIGLDYVAGARALTVAETRSRSGPDADTRAYLVLRPYLDRAVEVTVHDPADPVPYWLVSSRHPEALADRITDATGSTTSDVDAPGRVREPGRRDR